MTDTMHNQAPGAADERIALPHAPRELGLVVGDAGAVSYRQFYAAVLDGRVPARMDNGRWSVRRGDLPQIAEAFGLTPRVPGAPAVAARAAA